MFEPKLVNQDLYSFLILNYGSITALSLFLEDNDIDDISFFSTVSVGTKFKVSPYVVPVPSTLQTSKQEAELENSTFDIKVINQNLYDFVMTNYGNLSRLPVFLELNNMNSFSEFNNSPVGTKYNVAPQTNKVATSYRNNGYKVVTGNLKGVLFTGDYNNDFNNDFN